jgi:hypothetical protein
LLAVGRTSAAAKAKPQFVSQVLDTVLAQEARP